MNKTAIPLLILLLFFYLPEAKAQKPTGFFPVSKVVDGDTFWVLKPEGKEEKIRLIGVDTPEVRNTGRTRVEYFGKESSDFAKKVLTGRKVRLEYDVQRKDRYQRTLAYVYLENGTFFNALLVKEGYATVATFPPNVKYESLFVRLQKEAREKRKGLWGK
ncbi:micrococcal nuclease [Algoriphagus faecimaris]|uniref:Micrococcal nuclease n=1 Tax=Algoriphagus faecimaris TaxID=686796 RepID=A0A1G6MJ86_9BACT|nr:thermonuclease family protein [Algoriphagus faecimaris]SDC55668.1 micrococcal nuclease [Algoriphagus faecimaris]